MLYQYCCLKTRSHYSYSHRYCMQWYVNTPMYLHHLETTKQKHWKKTQNYNYCWTSVAWSWKKLQSMDDGMGYWQLPLRCKRDKHTYLISTLVACFNMASNRTTTSTWKLSTSFLDWTLQNLTPQNQLRKPTWPKMDTVVCISLSLSRYKLWKTLQFVLANLTFIDPTKSTRNFNFRL